MKRSAVIHLTVSMLILMGVVTSSVAAQSVTENGQAVLETVQETSELITLHWQAGELQMDVLEDGSQVCTMAGKNNVTTEATLPIHGGLLHLPWGTSAEIATVRGTVRRYSDQVMKTEDVIALDASPFSAESFVSVGASSIFRDFTVAPLNVTPVIENNSGEFWVLDDMEVEVRTVAQASNITSLEPVRPVSRAFFPIYQSFFLNELDETGIQLAETRGSYLVIVNEDLEQNIRLLVSWKRQKGYNVIVETFSSLNEEQEVKDIIRTKYETAEPPLEFVLLAGDVNSDTDTDIPSGRVSKPVTGDRDVSDYDYSLLEGNDYFPEILIGRIPLSTTTTMYNATRRVKLYEKPNLEETPLDDPYWDTGCTIAANHAEGAQGEILTPVATAQYLANKALNNWDLETMREVYWMTGAEVGSAEVAEAVNNGSMWIAYRGWGNATSWQQPSFAISDVNNLQNTGRLSVVTSFVCDTGDFGNEERPMFAEKWLTAGDVNGAVAFIGPTDLHTSTKFNNSLVTGFYHGLYEDNLTNISAALLRAKYELYLGFPDQRESDDANMGNVEYYHHVYHVLGDPEITMWRHRPKQMELDFEDNLENGQNFVEITVNKSSGAPLKNAYVQIIQGTNVAAGRFTNEAGVAIVPAEGLTETGNVIVTVTKPDYLPVQALIHTPETYTNPVDVASWSIDGGNGFVQCGVETNLSVTLTNNTSEALSGVEATLSYDGDVVAVSTADATFGDIAASENASTETPFVFTLTDVVGDARLIEFSLDVTAGSESWTKKMWLPVGSLVTELNETNVASGSFVAGETASLSFDIINHGGADLNSTVELVSFDGAVTINTASVSDVSIEAQSSATVGPFEVSVASGAYPGRPVDFRLLFKVGDTTMDVLPVTVSIEGVDATAPFGPDAYGYYLYENGDTNWGDNAPTYAWPDLENEASATHYEMVDDDIRSVELPFDISFYGKTYAAGSVATISSNGWFGLNREGSFSRNFFRNWHIPSVLGPQGFIAAFWDDLKPAADAQHMDIYSYYDEANGRFIIEWENAVNAYEHGSTLHKAEFAIVIYEADQIETPTGDCVIDLIYRDADNADRKNNYATIGIEREDKKVGLEYTFANEYAEANAALTNETALRFTTSSPDGISGVEDAIVDAPRSFELYANYPNPFNAMTEIRFDLARADHVKLSIYNVLGQEVARLVDRPMTAGQKKVVWQAGSETASGMYLVRLESDQQVKWSKAMFVK